MEYFCKVYPIQKNGVSITQDGKFNTLKWNLGLKNGILLKLYLGLNNAIHFKVN